MTDDTASEQIRTEQFNVSDDSAWAALPAALRQELARRFDALIAARPGRQSAWEEFSLPADLDGRDLVSGAISVRDSWRIASLERRPWDGKWGLHLRVVDLPEYIRDEVAAVVTAATTLQWRITLHAANYIERLKDAEDAITRLKKSYKRVKTLRGEVDHRLFGLRLDPALAELQSMTLELEQLEGRAHAMLYPHEMPRAAPEDLPQIGRIDATAPLVEQAKSVRAHLEKLGVDAKVRTHTSRGTISVTYTDGPPEALLNQALVAVPAVSTARTCSNRAILAAVATFASTYERPPGCQDDHDVIAELLRDSDVLASANPSARRRMDAFQIMEPLFHSDVGAREQLRPYAVAKKYAEHHGAIEAACFQDELGS